MARVSSCARRFFYTTLLSHLLVRVPVLILILASWGRACFDLVEPSGRFENECECE